MSTPFLATVVPIPNDARTFFSHISDQPWAMLLDSGSSGHVDANVDIVVHSPMTTLVTHEGLTVITPQQSPDKLTQSSDNPFDLIDQQLNQSGLGSIPCDYPFSGGALGYFSYDLARQCETLSTQAKQDISLPEMAVGIYAHAMIFNHSDDSVTLVSRSSQQAHQQQLNQIIDTAKRPLVPKASRMTSEWSNQITKTQYGEKFNAVQHYLRQGDCYQINLTQRFAAQHQGDEYQTYLTLAKNNNTPFSAFLRLPHCAILSVSPERFIQCHQNNIETKPIKGTRPRGKTPAQDIALANELLASEKDQSENLMIVDLLRNDISRCAEPGSVKVPKLFDIESFKNVHHLVSTIQAKLPDNITPATLLKRAFPGGSITGAPKIRAMNIIDELEPSRRSIYCGSIGYISADRQMDTSITIRTLLCIDDTLYCWAGGGIVADSSLEAEYQECFDKVASIIPLLQP